MATVELSCDFTYEAAHRLPYVADGHKCANMHGHSYRLTVTVRGPVGDDGFVTDFDQIKHAARCVINQLDHTCLNDLIANPTVENQLVWIWRRIDLDNLHQLTLRETDTNTATYRGD